MKRRQLLKICGGLLLLAAAMPLLSKRATADRFMHINVDDTGKIVMSDDEWRARLTAEQFEILRQEGTERPFSSSLNEEKRVGTYHCVGCEQRLFTSEMKYDSGTGWPSFFDAIDGAFEKKTDFKLVYPRKEYHCAKCGGHHGHLFKDGPEPTGERWCNNGAVLVFIPA